MLSVPLVWNESVVGVLNAQTTEAREFDADEVEFLVTIAALLPGIVEKGRLQAEAEAQLDRLSQLDAARAELLAVVTHELRTPLAVVRAYVDLLADAAAASDAAEHAGRPRRDLARRGHRPGHAARPAGRLDPRLRARGGPRRACAATRSTSSARSTITVGTLALLLRTRPVRWEPPPHALVARGDDARFRQVLEHLLDNEAKYAPPEQAVSIGAWRTPTRSRSTSPTTARACRSTTGRRCSSPTSGSTGPARAGRGSGCSPRAA